MGRELWSFRGLDAKGGDISKVTVLLFLIVSLSMDEFVGDTTVEGPDAAPRSLLEVVVAVFAVWGTCGVAGELFTVSAYVGGLLLEDSLGLDDGILWSSSGGVGADGVVGPGGVVPGSGGGGGGGIGEATL